MRKNVSPVLAVVVILIAVAIGFLSFLFRLPRTTRSGRGTNCSPQNAADIRGATNARATGQSQGERRAPAPWGVGGSLRRDRGVPCRGTTARSALTPSALAGQARRVRRGDPTVSGSAPPSPALAGAREVAPRRAPAALPGRRFPATAADHGPRRGVRLPAGGSCLCPLLGRWTRFAFFGTGARKPRSCPVSSWCRPPDKQRGAEAGPWRDWPLLPSGGRPVPQRASGARIPRGIASRGSRAQRGKGAAGVANKRHGVVVPPLLLPTSCFPFLRRPSFSGALLRPLPLGDELAHAAAALAPDLLVEVRAMALLGGLSALAAESPCRSRRHAWPSSPDRLWPGFLNPSLLPFPARFSSSHGGKLTP